MRSSVLLVGLSAMLLTLSGCEDKKSAPMQEPVPKEMTSAVAAAPAPAATIDTALLNAYAQVKGRIESPANTITDDKVALGRALYHETRLSKNQDRSCNSCHDLAKYGVDGEKTSEGHKGQRGARNSPTVYNAAGHFAQFWDAREKTIEDQALRPITNPVEMAVKDEKQIVEILRSIPGYAPLFKKAFPEDKEPINAPNTAKAIGAFERTLVTSSRWDKLLAGDMSALTDAEKAGFAKFADAGCPTCHSGAYLGGAELKKLGLAKPWAGKVDDTGRMAVTKAEADRLLFKVPSLRNVAKTAPYFHDGSIATLDEAVKLMARHQLGKELSDADVKSIVTFLGALTGDLPPADRTSKPELPPSGPKTPKPDPT
jgi:cytochrome c peroxidase